MRKPCTRLVARLLTLPAVAIAVTLAASSVGAQTAAGPDSKGAPDVLKARVERAWTVVRLQDGVLLVPRRAGTGIGGVEISGSRIAIDGDTVSREQLRGRLAGPMSIRFSQIRTRATRVSSTPRRGGWRFGS